ncbi:hypothetical protein AGMMS49959_02910 [Planctomycetales bacterium]|nr:hypothetical protein AGMMS49959_02910 [Planctomycetales bacterium]
MTNDELRTSFAEKTAAARNFFTAAHYYFAGQKFLTAVELRWRNFAAAPPNDGASARGEPEVGATAEINSEIGATASEKVKPESGGATARVEPESGVTATASPRQTAGAPLVHEAITITTPKIHVGEASAADRAAAPPNESAGESVGASVSENAEASAAAAALPHKDNVAAVAGEIKAENLTEDLTADAAANLAAAAAEDLTADATANLAAASPSASSGEKLLTGDLAVGRAAPARPADEGANERDLAAIQRRGVLVVGMLRDNPPPFADGDENGCDADWAAALARALKVKLQINRDFDSTATLLTAVADGGIDAAISGLKIGSPTAAGVEIASPYLGNWTVLLLNFAALATIPNGEFLTPEALNRPEVIVAVEANSPYEKIARELFPRATLRREVYADGASPFLSVFGKDAHVALRDSFSLLRDRREHPRRWEQRGAEVTVVKLRRHRELYGVALAKTAPRLRALLDRLDAEINDLPLPFQQLTIHN